MTLQKITIRIADRTHRIDVSSPEQEEVMRKAEAEIRKRLEKRLMGNVWGKDIVDHLSLIALEMGVKYFSAQKSLDACQEESRQLHRNIEGYLENIDK